MKDDVLIILNIRQLQKKNLANELLEELNLRRYSCTILEPTENLPQLILERSPRVLVLDYVLGDYSSALDVLPAVSSESNPNPPSVVLWTDDPSTAVAVTAMKLGAKDYVQMTGNRDVSRVLAALEPCLDKSSSKIDSRKPVSKLSKPNLVGDTALWHQVLQTTQSYASSGSGCNILLGPKGSGRSALAQHFHFSRSKPGQFFEIELDLWTEKYESIFGCSTHDNRTKLLANKSTVFIDHAEFDSGDLLKHYEAAVKEQNDPFSIFLLGTSCEQTARAWSELAQAKIIEIPSLERRAEDIWPMLRKFLQEAKKLFSTASIDLSSEIITHLTSLPWPGNVRQLRDVAFEVCTLDIELNDQCAAAEKLSTKDRKILSKFLFAKERWERQIFRKPELPEAKVALDALEKSGGDFRIAAAMIGVGVPQVRKAFHNGGA